jgi:hypothetical protein
MEKGMKRFLTWGGCFLCLIVLVWVGWQTLKPVQDPRLAEIAKAVAARGYCSARVDAPSIRVCLAKVTVGNDTFRFRYSEQESSLVIEQNVQQRFQFYLHGLDFEYRVGADIKPDGTLVASGIWHTDFDPENVRLNFGPWHQKKEAVIPRILTAVDRFEPVPPDDPHHVPKERDIERYE